MTVRCPSCQASFHVADDKIPARGASARCPRCDAPFDISATVTDAGSVSPASTGADLFELSPGALEEVHGEDLFAVHDKPAIPAASAPMTDAPSRRKRGLFSWLGGLFGRS